MSDQLRANYDFEDSPWRQPPGRVGPWREPPEIIIATVVPEPTPPQTPIRRSRRWKLPLALFVATCLSTFIAGAKIYDGQFSRFNAADGLVYAACLMTILVCHEMGHFIQAKRHGVYASLPFFLPMPVSPIGTFGAVIAMDSRIRDRRALFDIGITGPLAGLIPALVFSVIGLHWSQPVSRLRVAELVAAGGGPDFLLGSSMLFSALAHWIHPAVDGSYGLSLSPMAQAGWVGLLVTALNLLPIGQLDGGHVLYALIRRRAHTVAMVLLVLAMAAVVLLNYVGWMLMVLLLILMGPRHPPTANDYVPLGLGRAILGWLTLAFVVVGFTPQPITPFDVREFLDHRSRPIEARCGLPVDSVEGVQVPGDRAGLPDEGEEGRLNRHAPSGWQPSRPRLGIAEEHLAVARCSTYGRGSEELCSARGSFRARV